MVSLFNSHTLELRRFLFFLAERADRCWLFRVCCTGDVPSKVSARGGTKHVIRVRRLLFCQERALRQGERRAQETRPFHPAGQSKRRAHLLCGGSELVGGSAGGQP